MSWSTPTDPDTVRRRAAGRRRYNAWRRLTADLRRNEVCELLLTTGLGHGAQAAIARRLGVHRSTVHRDVWAMIQDAIERRRCPICGACVAPARAATGCNRT